MNIYDFTVKDQNGNLVPLSNYKGKTLLIVNTATECIFTPQYEALERLYQEMKEREFEILDFPCDQFGHQLKPTMEQVFSFCKLNYNISFKQFDKVDVRGENAEPLFKYLQEQIKFEGFGLHKGALRANFAFLKQSREEHIDKDSGIRWNFTKFLIDKDGNVVTRFEPSEPIELVRQDVNRLLNGEDLSKKNFISRFSRDRKTSATKKIERKRYGSLFKFAILAYILLFILDLWIMQLNGIAVFRDELFPKTFIPDLFAVNDAGQRLHENGFMAIIFMDPGMIYKQLLLPVPAVCLLSLFFYALTRKTSKRINKLCSALEQASEGNLNYRLKPSEKDIFFEPFDDFNKMAYKLKENVKSLEIAANEAKAASEAKSNFLSNMSHEIRTPLNAVLGMDEMIIRESSEKDIVNYAIDIQNAGKILLSLINDILDFSKIEANKMEIVEVEYDLSSVINDLLNMTSEKAKNKGLKLNVEVDETMPHLLRGDEIRVKQICLNIINNAIKYTDEGSVNVKFEAALVDGKNAIRFTCVDTGQGIREEDIPKLTEPFARIDEKRNRSIEGSGLGMSITTNLLDMMGSKLELVSEYGKGSTFSFVVKQEQISDEAIGDFAESYRRLLESHEQYVESFHAKDAHILVVDDVEMNLTVVKSFLKKTLVNLDTCSSGKEALSLANTKKYDIIFLDHMMPDMDGIETMQAIKNGGGINASTPIIVLTANAVSGAREKYTSVGFDDYLTKPIESARLERIIEKNLPDELVEHIYLATEAEELVNYKEDETVSKISMIEGIDIEAGITNSGGADAYASIVENFGNTAASRISMINDYWKAMDFKNYTIQVHALKSSARLVGHMELSELARKLEECGNNQDIDTINLNTDRLLYIYNQLAESINLIFEANASDKELVDNELLADGIQSLYESLEVFDMDMADGILEELDKYKMPENFADTFKQIKVLMGNVDRDALLNIINDTKNVWR